jgi:hypothetical protein
VYWRNEPDYGGIFGIFGTNDTFAAVREDGNYRCYPSHDRDHENGYFLPFDLQNGDLVSCLVDLDLRTVRFGLNRIWDSVVPLPTMSPVYFFADAHIQEIEPTMCGHWTEQSR